MTTASTNTTFSNGSSALFQAIVNEIYTNLVTNCGLSQAADTGQMTVPCTTTWTASVNTSLGYYVFAFNDALQATSPIYIRMDFGNGNVTTSPASLLLAITVGSSTNGAGTITGTHIAPFNCSCSQGNASGGGVTNYVSRYCYNATQGVLGMVYKINGIPGATANAALAGFHIFRSVDNTGAPTATVANVLGWTYNALTGAGTVGAHAFVDYSTSTAGQTANPGQWGAIPYATTSSIQGTTAQVFPVWQFSPTATQPGYGITNAGALAILNEVALNSTCSATVLGSTSLTYMSVGTWCGSSPANYSNTVYSYLMLWQ